MPPYKAIYFDLDDTLCGYWDASKIGMREAFAAEGIEPEAGVLAWADAFRLFLPEVRTDWYKVYLKNAEPTRTEQMRRTLLNLGIDDPAKARRLGDLYAERRDANLKLFPDAIPVLDELFGKFVLGLITNGPADVQRQEIATLGIGHYFDHVFIEGEQDLGKPHPEVFRRAAEAANAQPNELLMVGNSYGHDVKGALDSGWNAIWIRRESDVAPSATRPEEMPEGAPEPTAIIGELSELLPLV